MNKIYQKISYLHPQFNRAAGIGDCHSAALASLLNIPLESVPLDIRTVHAGDMTHYERINKWLKKRFRLELITCDANFIEKYKHYFLYRRYYITILKYHTTHHAVVGYSGSIVHNPAPWKNNLHKGITHYEFLAKFHPTVYYGVQYVGNKYQRCRKLLLGPEAYVNV